MMITQTIRGFLLALPIITLVAAIPIDARAQQATPGGFPNLVPALRTAPGCLGVELAQTAGGKQVIFAWFEGKKALVDWYYSEPHQRAMRTVFPDTPFEHNQLPLLADDAGPILAIVSVKFSDEPKPDVGPRPITSIGIELYGPLPGGIAVGSKFAPAALKVKGLRELPVSAGAR